MELKKVLTTTGVFSLGAGAMVSSGLFILPAIAFSEAGTGVLLAYLLAGICMIPAVFAKLELTSAIPRAGGAYFYLSRIFGAGVGTVAGLADWFSIAFKSAFALIGIGVFGSLIFPSFGETEFKIVAVGACVLFTAINLLSVKGTARFQVFMVAFLLAILIAFVLVGYRRMDFGHYTAGPPLVPFAILRTTGMVFISYGGITKVAAAVEEVKDPKRMLVPGMLGAFIVVQVLYLLVIFVTIGAMEPERLAASYSPLTDAAAIFLANPIAAGAARAVVAAGGLLAFFTTANAGILSASRVPLAMSRDGLLPGLLGRVSARKGTPVAAILATGGFMIGVIVALDVQELAKVASLFLLLVFFLESLGLIVIRASRIANYRPVFRSPWFPVLPIFGVAVYGVLIGVQGSLPLLVAAGFIVLSVLWYLVYGRRGWSRTSAFVTMVKRLSEPDFAESGDDLEDELLEVLMERDNITEDRFDALVKEAPVLDYDHTVDREQFFADVGRLLSERWAIDPDKLAARFADREDQTPTVIYPGVAVPHAIPHVVMEGSSIFDLVLCRARFGIRWSESEVVYTAFAMVGSKDERSFHLKALMSIAQILQDPGFMKAWNEATSERELRTALILIKRKRHHT
jgi:amino acid transporter/mannitol/fructose-specific phosphotransferase system IIA component (Ntr-type)